MNLRFNVGDEVDDSDIDLSRSKALHITPDSPELIFSTLPPPIILLFIEMLEFANLVVVVIADDAEFQCH